jgi:hypothetical protein
MRRILPILFLSFIGIYAKAQTPNGFVGIGNALPKAKLDIASDTSGILIPRYATLADVNTNVLPKMSATDHNGLTLYVAEVANRGFWFYNGTAFEKIGAGSGSGGFFKVSSTDANHIIYSAAANYGKNFLVNTDSVNYDGSGTDAKMMFIPSKSAARLGGIQNKNWDRDSIGNYSFASGVNTKAKGIVSNAMGYSTTASGYSSTAIGGFTNASGDISTAMGVNTIASGFVSIAMGENSTASGDNSTAVGYYTIASGIYSTAMGGNNTASGSGSTAMGIFTNASGISSTAIGNSTNASGVLSTAMGYNTKAQGYGELSMGTFNDTLVAVNATAFASDSNRVFTVGNGTSSSTRKTAFVVQQNGNVGINTRVPSEKLDITGSIKIVDGTEGAGKVLTSDANGKGSWAAVPSSSFFKVSSTDANHIIYSDATNYGKNFLVNTDSVNYDGSGLDTKMMLIPSKSATRIGVVSNNNWDRDSIGIYSFASGYNTKAKGPYSTAMGSSTTASGFYTTAMGNTTVASGNTSTAMGASTIASGYASLAMGASTIASGTISTALGMSTKAKSYGELSMGIYNDTLAAVNATAFAGDSNRVFTVGNGTSATRKTAFVVQQNGNVGVGDRKPSSLLDVNGSLSLPFQSITADYTATINDYTIRFSGSTASQTVTLPAASSCTGRMYRIVNAGSVALGISSIINLAGTATTSLSATTAVLVQSDGTNWYSIQ